MMSLIPTESEILTISKIAEMALKSGLLPSTIRTVQQAIVIALKGRELNIPPFQAFAKISIINGKPCMDAELMISLALRDVRTAEINYKQNDNTACVISARRNSNNEFSTFSFTIDDARAAGLLNKDTWKKYPAAMLRARAISAMCRALFADAVAGVSHTPEEMGAEVNEEGEVLSVNEQTSNKTNKPATVVKDKEFIESIVPENDKIKPESNNDEIHAASNVDISDSLNYKLTFTKDSGKTLKQVLDERGADYLITQCIKIEEHFNKKKMPMDDLAKTYIQHARCVAEHANV